MKATNRKIFILLALGLWLWFQIGNLGVPRTAPNEFEYSTFISEVQQGRVKEVVIEGKAIEGLMNDGTAFKTHDPGDNGLVADLLEHNVRIVSKPPAQPGMLTQIIVSWMPMLLLIGVWVWFMRRNSGGTGAGGLFNFGKSRARQMSEGEVKVTLADVAGVDEAKEEIGEIVEFLRNPDKFRRIGGMVPRGVLMIGPPGTGKTLLAKAIAGEAKVPFFSIAGSDFVEMFVGVGASRVRDLFAQAKKNAPCIIFVDEIDAVGRRRGAGMGGGHDEREQTLNQMLVEMDGFDGNEGIIVVAATNRPDVLDPALLRPGRFDRQVTVGLPDVLGREQILNLHIRKVPIGDDVDAKIIARGTPGFSGADLANLVNEAALIAARCDMNSVNMEMFEKAKDKIIMGTERHTMVMSPQEKELTAYHEAGHTIVGRMVPEHDPVHKVSIIPRGRALGVTLFLPEKDRYSASKRLLESQIATLFGGRLAEELIYGPDAVTTGAQNDIEKATALARNMVIKWGLSDKLSPIAYNEEEGEVFLGRSVTQHKNVSDETSRLIDEEIGNIIDRNYERARKILTDNIGILHSLAEALVVHETLDSEQIDAIMSGESTLAARDDSSTPPPSTPPTVGSDDANSKDGVRGKIPIGRPVVQN